MVQWSLVHPGIGIGSIGIGSTNVGTFWYCCRIFPELRRNPQDWCVLVGGKIADLKDCIKLQFTLNTQYSDFYFWSFKGLSWCVPVEE